MSSTVSPEIAWIKDSSFRGLIFGAVAALLLSEPAPAAEITTVPQMESLERKLDRHELDALIDISGPIEAGDAGKFASVVSALNVDQLVSGADGVDVIVRLDSPGGSFKEAIEIARTVKTNQLQTFIERKSECLSACAVIFMAGTYQPGFRQQEERWRKVEWPARLGFHRPFIGQIALDIPQEVLAQLDAKDLAAIFNDEFSAAFDAANELIQEMLRADPAAWSPELLVRMLTATSKSGDGQFVYLETVDDALIWGIDILNAVPPKGGSKQARFVENYWLCYNAGRGIPAYSGIWANIADAEKSLEDSLDQLDRVLRTGRPGPRWDGKMIEDDDLTYYTRINSWVFGCTTRYQEVGGRPEITFFHDDATVTQIKLLERHNPGLKLDHVVAVNATGDSVEATENILGGSGSTAAGRCYVFRGQEKLDDERCRQSTWTDVTVGLIEEYMWPSGSKTVVIRSEDQVSVNGARSRPDISGRDLDFCYRSEKTGNTFCFDKR